MRTNDTAGEKKRRKDGAASADPALRLKQGPESSGLTRKDRILMLVICVVYAAVAFTNLGAYEIPQNGYMLEEGGDDLVLAFDEPHSFAYLMYYAGYGAGAFAVSGSMDGEHWEDVWLVNNFGTTTNMSQEMVQEQRVLSGVIQQYGDMFRWVRRHTQQEAQYLRFSPRVGSVDMRELALIDDSSSVVVPASVRTSGGEVVTALTDEQELIALSPTYLTDFYFDEIYHVRTAYEHLEGLEPYEITHPPLGKILISLGISLFGMTPFGWRFSGTVAGVAMLAVLYALAKELFGKTRYAALAAVLFAADFMHFTQTRIGTVDSFSVLWILLAYLFMYRYSRTNFNLEPLKRTLPPLFLSGLFFGIGAATKWICLYAGIGLLIVWVLILRRRRQEYVYMRAERHRIKKTAAAVQNYPRSMRITVALSLVFFLAVPAGIYLASYLPHTLITQGKSWTLDDILRNQWFMLTYHGNLVTDAPHPYASMWYTWPLDVRPVLFYAVHSDLLGLSSVFSTFGNPLVWWGGCVGSVCMCICAARRKEDRSFGLLFTATAALCQYVPWWFISRELFIYHFFSVVPFMILLLVYWLRTIESRFTHGRIVVAGYAAACVLAFALFYPVISGTAASTSYIKSLAWLPTWPF